MGRFDKEMAALNKAAQRGFPQDRPPETPWNSSVMTLTYYPNPLLNRPPRLTTLPHHMAFHRPHLGDLERPPCRVPGVTSTGSGFPCSHTGRCRRTPCNKAALSDLLPSRSTNFAGDSMPVGRSATKERNRVAEVCVELIIQVASANDIVLDGSKVDEHLTQSGHILFHQGTDPKP